MKATVRIASMEHWCPETRASTERMGLNVEAIVGRPVTILTNTRHFWNQQETEHHNIRACAGAYWDVERESANEIARLFNVPESDGFTRVICEHMLEMD